MASAESHRRASVRRTRSVAATESASAVFADLAHGCEIAVLTHGQFSFIDALQALLAATGPADVTISTWSAANVDLEHARRFLDDGRVRSLRFLVDRSFATRQPDYCATLIRLFGPDAIRTTRLHAKFATIRNDEWALAVRTSMNLNENPRLEYIEVSDDADFASFLDGVVDEVYASQPPSVMNGELPKVRPSIIRSGATVQTGPR